MRKLGSVGVVAVAGSLLTLAIAAWTRQPSAQAGATITGKVKFTGTKPAMPKIDMSEDRSARRSTPRLRRPRRPWS